MHFTASIKPTSTIHARWLSRTQVCGFIQGVCFVRKVTKSGPRYIADKLTESQIHQLKDNVAVSLAVTAIRVPEKAEEYTVVGHSAPQHITTGTDNTIIGIPQPPKRVKVK